MSAASSNGRSIRDVNLVFLSSGKTISVHDIVTAAEGQAILDDLDGAIPRIEDDLACNRQRSDPEWRERAEMALKKKRRQRPALQQRIGDLRRAEPASLLLLLVIRFFDLGLEPDLGGGAP